MASLSPPLKKAVVVLFLLGGMLVPHFVLAAGQGDACAVDRDCQDEPDLYCDSQEPNPLLVCIIKRQIGDSCKRDVECMGGGIENGISCDAGICKPAICINEGMQCGGDLGTNCCLPSACSGDNICAAVDNSAPQTIMLLEPINGTDSVPANPTNNGPCQSFDGPFFAYFSLLYPWLEGMGAGICILMGLVGGIQIMTAGADQGKRTAGTHRFLISIGGLLLFLFASTILNMLNPTFFSLGIC